MNYANDPERERVLTQALEARTPQEVETALQELRHWVKAYPDDLGIVDAFEPLTLRRMTFAEEARGTVSTHAGVI